MKRFIAALLLLLSSPAIAQQLPFTLPANTVIGRTSVTGNSGPAYAIPFSQFAAALNPFFPSINPNVGTFGSSTQCGTFTVTAQGFITAASQTACSTGITQLTGDVTAGPGSGSQAATLASTITAAGPIGSATVAPIITFDAKGRLTTVASATITPSISNVAGLAAGVATALGTNIGSAGGPVLFNGVGGTPLSLTLTNATGLPLGSVTGLGTGCATWLATPSSANLRSCITDETGTGLAYFQGGALGTPSSGTLTSATGLPISTGLTGAGTGVLTALGVNVGSAGSVLLNGGANAAYTPTFGCGSAGPLTTASAAGRWQQTAKMVFFTATLTITTNGTCAGFLQIGLPATALTAAGLSWVLSGADSTALGLVCFISSAASSANCFSASGAYPGVSGRTFTVTGTYEVP